MGGDSIAGSGERLSTHATVPLFPGFGGMCSGPDTRVCVLWGKRRLGGPRPPRPAFCRVIRLSPEEPGGTARRAQRRAGWKGMKAGLPVGLEGTLLFLFFY